MAIPASRIVQITPRVVQAAGSDLALNGCFLTASRLVPLGRMRGFPDADAVGEAFGFASDEYKAASVYFAGYEGAFKRPRVIWFGSRAGTTVTARLQGSTFEDESAALTAIKDTATAEHPGRLIVSVNGMGMDLKGLVLTGQPSLEEIAGYIQGLLSEKLHGTQCVYADGAFTIIAPPTPSGSRIAVATQTPLSTAMGLSAVAGAKAVQEELVPGGAAGAVLKGAKVTASMEDFHKEKAGRLSMKIDGAEINITGVDLSQKGHAYLYGGIMPFANLAELRKVDDGSVSMTINGEPVTVGGVNLTGKAVLFGGAFANAEAEAAALTTLQGITAGAFSMEINGAPVELTGVNLSAQASLLTVAGAIHDAIVAQVPNATFVYDAEARRFVVRAPKPESGESTIALPVDGENLAPVLGLTAAAGATVTPDGESAEATLSGGVLAAPDEALATLKGINSGSLSLKVNGTPVWLTGVDLSESETLAAVATTLQAGLAAVVTGTTCIYDATEKQFIITAPAPESGSSTITLADGVLLATALGITAAAGARANDSERIETDFYGVARTMNAKLNEVVPGATFSFDSYDERFVVSAPIPATGESSILMPDNGTAEDLATLLRLTSAADATATQAQFVVQSFSDVAAIVGAKIAVYKPGAVCTYSSLTKSFWVYSPSTGAASTITLADLPGSEANASVLPVIMGLCAEVDGTPGTAGATAEQGTDAMTVAENFASLKGSSENWALFTTVYRATDEETLALASWAAKQGVEYLYIAWSTNDALRDPDESASIAAKLKDANADATALVYGDLSYAAFILGIPASIDWNRSQAVVTAAFKHQGGLGPYVDNASDAEALLSKRCNFYGTYASRNDQFVWLYDGSMYGDYRFMDAFWNTIWLSSAIQTACMQGFKQTPRVPYNEDGFSLIRSWIQDPINRGLKNGCIDAGLNLSEAQKAQFLRETALDDQALSVLENDGYFLMVRDAGPQIRPNRDSPEVVLYYSYAGSCHRLDIPATMFV